MTYKEAQKLWESKLSQTDHKPIDLPVLLAWSVQFFTHSNTHTHTRQTTGRETHTSIRILRPTKPRFILLAHITLPSQMNLAYRRNNRRMEITHTWADTHTLQRETVITVVPFSRLCECVFISHRNVPNMLQNYPPNDGNHQSKPFSAAFIGLCSFYWCFLVLKL